MKIISFRLVVFISVVTIGLAPGCIKKKDARVVREMRSRSIEQVFDAQRETLLSIPGVVGAGIAKLDQKPCIMVLVRAKTDSLLAQIPKELDGYKVIVEQTGDIKALDGR